MAEDELTEALIGLMRAASGACERIAHPLVPINNEHPITCVAKLDADKIKIIHQVNLEDSLDISGTTELVEVKQLIRIVHNAARSADKAEYQLSGRSKLKEASAKRSAYGHIVKLKRCLNSLADLLGRENYVVRTPQWDELNGPEWHQDADLENPDIFIAYLYERIKNLSMRVPHDNIYIRDTLESIMTDIRSRSGVKADG